MEGSKTLFCSSKIPMGTRKDFFGFAYSLGTRPQKRFPALPYDIPKVRSPSLNRVAVCHAVHHLLSRSWYDAKHIIFELPPILETVSSLKLDK